MINRKWPLKSFNLNHFTANTMWVDLIALQAFPCGVIEVIIDHTWCAHILALALKAWLNTGYAILYVGIEKMANITLKTVLFWITFFALLNTLLAPSILVYKEFRRTAFAYCRIVAFLTVFNAWSACSILPNCSLLTLDTFITIGTLNAFDRAWLAGSHLHIQVVSALANCAYVVIIIAIKA